MKRNKAKYINTSHSPRKKNHSNDETCVFLPKTNLSGSIGMIVIKIDWYESVMSQQIGTDRNWNGLQPFKYK